MRTPPTPSCYVLRLRFAPRSTGPADAGSQHPEPNPKQTPSYCANRTPLLKRSTNPPSLPKILYYILVGEIA